MDREIKFRLWEKNLKKMLFLGDGILEEIYFDGLPWEAHTELMQWTGLKDADGKEIYEDDIVEIKENFPFDASTPWRGKIIWHYGGFSVGWEWIEKRGDKEEKKLGTTGMSYFAGSYLTNIKVIGNIHENSELYKIPARTIT